MQPSRIDVFFSCSFTDGDKKINEFFLTICRALGFNPTNVSTGSSLTPPDVAKCKIEACQALIAVCTRREELKNGKFLMPTAVHDEISFAYGMNTPILMLVEEGVVLDGFKSNFGTYLQFNRKKLQSVELLEKAIEAIFALRTETLGPYEAGTVYGMAEANAEYVHHMVELRAAGADFIWQYSTSKKLVYSHASKRGIPAAFWANVSTHIPEDAPDLRWEIKLDSSSRNIRLEPTVERQNPTCIEAIIKLVPSPDEGDFVEYSTVAESRYLNPVWADEIAGGPVHLNNADYGCADGLVFIHRTKRAVIEFRFAKEYGLERTELTPFVASYTSAIDYEVESELKRVACKFEQFGGNAILRMEIESPLPGHMYGLAWNPKPRPDAGETGSNPSPGPAKGADLV